MFTSMHTVIKKTEATSSMHTPYSETRFVHELGNTQADQRISRKHIKHVIILLRVRGAYNVGVYL